ncbi:MAG TPA: SBBP repeat-containing protein, partial [candidate division Zixibacteria bacterium]|nr:SBBP repeat-containing protein [candidate division Zixibacteria bacterium]
MTRTLKFPAKIPFLFCTLFCLYSPFVFSQQVDTAWVRRYNGPGNGDDKAVAIAVDSSGNVYVTGSCFDSATGYDYCTIKYLPNGDTAWVRRYDGPGRPDGLEGQNDFAVALALDKAGNVYVTGTVATPLCLGGYGSRDIVTIKYLPNGDTGWLRGTFAAFCDRADLSALGLAMDSRSNLYIAGQGFHPMYGWYGIALKYDSGGNAVWGVSRGLSDPSNALSPIAVDPMGNSVCVIGPEGIFKYDSLGNQVWAQPFLGTVVGLDLSNNVFINSFNGIAKLDPFGNLLWNQPFTPFPCGRCYEGTIALESNGDGSIYVAGFRGYWEILPEYFFEENLLVAKFDSSGNRVWITGLSGDSGEVNVYIRPNSMALDMAGNVYLAGLRSRNFVTVKFDPNGNTEWFRTYDGPTGTTDEAKDIAVSNDGSVYVAGISP